MKDFEVLKNFLVRLGWDVDRGGEARFKESVASATKAVAGLAAGLEAAAVAGALWVHKIASSFESVYYASGRINASVANINAFRYAVSQLGGSAEGAMASLEAFSRKMREGPGQEAFLQSWGVKTRDAAGRIRESTDLIRDLLGSAKFQQQPDFVRLRIAESIGLDERTYRALLLDVDRFTSEYRKKLASAGLDPDVAAKNAQKFEQAWRSMATSFRLIGDQIGTALAGKGGGKLDEFITFLDRNSGKIASGIVAIGTALMTAAEWIAKLIVKFGEWAEKADPWIEKTFGIKNGFEKLAAVLLLLYATRIPALIAAMASLVGGSAWRALFAGLAALGVAGAAAALVGVGAAGAGIAAAGGGPMSADEAEKERKYGAGTPEIIKRLDRGGRRLWRKFFGGGGDEGAGAGGAPGAGYSGAPMRYGKLSQDQRSEMASAIRSVAAKIGANPEELAAVMSFETGGTMNPHKIGGAGNRYRGLIQWGPQERKDYFGSDENFYKATITEQVEAAGRFLRDRGYKPGMPMEALYSSILAGRAEPKYWDRTDANGVSPRSGVAEMRRSAHARALAGLERAPPGSAMAAPHTGQIPADMRGKTGAPLPTPGGIPGAPPWAGGLVPMSAAPLGGSFGLSGPRSVEINQSNTFHVDGARDPGATARSISGMQSQTNSDMVRVMQGSAH